MSISDTCKVCGASSEKVKLLKCSRCRTVYYCSSEHQKEDWKNHKKNCKPFEVSLKQANSIPLPCYILGITSHPELFGVLTNRVRYQMTKMPVAQTLLHNGDLQIPSPNGYVENVMVFDRMNMRFLFISRIHRQAIELLCGSDSLALIESRRSIEGSAWITTGGNALKAKKEGLWPLLHEIVRNVTQSDIDSYLASISDPSLNIS